MKITAILRLARNKIARKLLAKRAREKHILEAEDLSVRLHFANTLQDRPSHEVPTKLSILEDFYCNFLTIHPYYIYLYYPQKLKKGYSERKP